MAAKANPNVLLNILARVQQPGILTNLVFFLTGQHFTLFLFIKDNKNLLAVLMGLRRSSGLFMAYWASNNPDIKNAVLKACSREPVSEKFALQNSSVALPESSTFP